jgi:hypothetical protein
MSTLEEIKQLLHNLPSKDIRVANNFIEQKDFLSLRDLVDSAEFKVRKNLTGINPKEEYLQINIQKLRELQYRVQEYTKQFDVEQYINPYSFDYI